jgi:hypothetical protein
VPVLFMNPGGMAPNPVRAPPSPTVPGRVRRHRVCGLSAAAAWGVQDFVAQVAAAVPDKDCQLLMVRPTTSLLSAESTGERLRDFWLHWEALGRGTRNTPHSTSPPGDARVSGRVNTPSWVIRDTPNRVLGHHQLSQRSSMSVPPPTPNAPDSATTGEAAHRGARAASAHRWRVRRWQQRGTLI